MCADSPGRAALNVKQIKKEIRRKLGSRPKQSHKGDYGRVFVLAGSHGMSGACFLASMAALRSGAGLVTAGIPKSLTLPLARKMTEAMTLALPETSAGTLSKSAFSKAKHFLEKQDALAIGPGLSLSPETRVLIRRVVLSSRKPMVIDADALTAFQGKVSLLKKRKAPAVLTPHPGEFVRLFGGSVPNTDLERKKRALHAAKKFGVVLVLKGHHTVVASPNGEIYVNETGNPGMATGGSGDVLTGVISAMLGQGIPPFFAACFGVLIHGLAGDLAAKEKGEISLLAGDILNALPRAFKKLI